MFFTKIKAAVIVLRGIHSIIKGTSIMKKAALLLSVLVSISSTQLLHAAISQETKDTLKKGSLIALGAAVVGGVIYKCISWLTRDISHQELLARAHNSFASVDRDAGIVHTAVSALYKPGQYVSEAYLAGLTIEQRVIGLQQLLPSWKKTVSTEIKAITSRINTLEKSGDDDEILDEMRVCKNLLTGLVSKLELIQKFNDEHGGYFILYAKIKSAMSLYDRVINNPTDALAIKQAVMRFKIDSGCHYPFERYVQKLRNSIIDLERFILIDRYPVLSQQAQYIINQLNAVIDLIIVSTEYDAEQKQKQHDYYEQQRIDALQKQARAQEEKARAEYEKAHAMHNQADAMRDQARAQHSSTYTV